MNEREQFEAWWRAKQLETHPYPDRVCPANWGALYKPIAEAAWQAARAAAPAEQVTLCRWTWNDGRGHSGWFVAAKPLADIKPITNDFGTMTPEFATAVIVETKR